MRLGRSDLRDGFRPARESTSIGKRQLTVALKGRWRDDYAARPRRSRSGHSERALSPRQTPVCVIGPRGVCALSGGRSTGGLADHELGRQLLRDDLTLAIGDRLDRQLGDAATELKTREANGG